MTTVVCRFSFYVLILFLSMILMKNRLYLQTHQLTHLLCSDMGVSAHGSSDIRVTCVVIYLLIVLEGFRPQVSHILAMR